MEVKKFTLPLQEKNAKGYGCVRKGLTSSAKKAATDSVFLDEAVID
jgi:hypothetical protein